MLNWFKKRKEKSEAEKQINQSSNYSFKWYDIGEGNPFNKRILDIRSYTGTLISTTSVKSVAEKYNSLRNSLGEEYIGSQISNNKLSETNLEYPHNGTKLDGVAFKADTMDCKWDIYVYNDFFYFTRSWSGDLVYKVKSIITKSKIVLKEIEHSENIDPKDAINAVHYLMKSHAIGQPFPHKIPNKLVGEKEIAIWSFKEYGNRAFYATYDEVTDTIIKIKE